MRTDGGTNGPDGILAAFLEAMAPVPVFARDRHLTVVAANTAARRLSTGLRPGSNLLRWAFLGDEDPECDLAVDLPEALVGLLHDSLAQHDEDPGFRTLVGELASRDGAFTRLWAGATRSAAHSGDVGRTRSGTLLRYRELRLVDDYERVVVVLYEVP